MAKWPLTILFTAFALVGCDDKSAVEGPDIAYAPLADTELVDPDNPAKTFHVDLARVEHEHPLSREDLMKITPENIRGLEQEKVDQIYGRLTAGPIPDGVYYGDLFFRRGETLGTRLGEILGGIKGRLADKKIEKLEKIGRLLWKGKRFYRDDRLLRNLIEDLVVLKPLVGDDTSGIETEWIERRSWLRHFLPADEVWLLFPAKLYCGQSLLDGRRESVIIDYAFTDDLPGYREKPDSLAGRKGMRVRDEIRMIRPGFYLGRAYVNRSFLLNFTLYNEEVADAGNEGFAAGTAVGEDCWIGEQRQTAASK